MANVLLGLTGGIAAYKSLLLTRRLRAAGHEVRCALSSSATRFVTPLSLEVLTGNAVHQEEYLAATGTGEELHITLAEWADVACIAPATTNTVVRLAHGLADDFLTTTLTAFSGPLVLAPAMHTEMWRKPATQEAVSLLQGRGCLIVGPATGALASGEVGEGRMSEPAEIASAVEAACVPDDYRDASVLVTAGPTYEPIDPVRFLGNRSSGRMGFAIATAAAQRGAEVRLIAGPCHLATPFRVERTDVTSCADLQAALREAAPADLIVMCAAVADFRAAEVGSQKIKRAGKSTMELDLAANPDLLQELSTLAPEAVRVGFAAETENLAAHAREKLRAKGAHFLCANDVSRSDIGFEAMDNELTVFSDDADPVQLPKASKQALAHQLLDLFKIRLDRDSPR